MQPLIRLFIRYRAIILILFGVMLAAGSFALSRLDIEAYPDPSPPLVEIITQNPSWSAEEMEQQVTVPVETALNGTPHLEEVRSISIFGLSDVKLYFRFDSEYFRDRQEVLNRLQTLSLPNNLQPQLSPWSPIGEIFRYQLSGPGYTLNELKATQDWLVRRELKRRRATFLARPGRTARGPHGLGRHNFFRRHRRRRLNGGLGGGSGGLHGELGRQRERRRGRDVLRRVARDG